MGGGEGGNVRIMPFSMNWIEPCLDLREKTDDKDPLYTAGEVSRDERRARFLRQVSQGTTCAHLVATQGDRLVASAKAILIPTCGDDASKIATLALTVDPACRGTGIGTRLVDRLCEELASQDVNGLEIGVMNSWTGWRRFLAKCGFEPSEATVDMVLSPDAPTDETLPEVDATVGPARLPEDEEELTEFFNRERGQDLPRECRLTPAFWEQAAIDPEGFLVARDPSGGTVIGTVWGFLFSDGQGVHGILDMLDVRKSLLKTGLRRRLLVQSIQWLRDRGVTDIQTRVHVGYRDEEELYASVGFEAKATASVWRRPIHR